MPIHDVGDAIREQQAGSKHIKSRKQAIAIGLQAEGKSKKPGSGRRHRIQKAAFESAKKRTGAGSGGY